MRTARPLALALLLPAAASALAGKPGYGVEVSTSAGMSHNGWGGPGDVQYGGGTYATGANATASVDGASA